MVTIPMKSANAATMPTRNTSIGTNFTRRNVKKLKNPVDTQIPKSRFDSGKICRKKKQIKNQTNIMRT